MPAWKLQVVFCRYKFKQPDLLRLALQEGMPSAIQLSWIGDSLLYFLITELLAGRYPTAPVGQCHNAREKLLSRQSCAL